MTTCAGCETETTTPVGGLCLKCVADCYWIVRPVAHREMTRRRHATEAAHYRRLGYEIIIAIPSGNDEWYCDACNATIVVAGDVHLIPALGSWAFCVPCVTDLASWPDAWATPRPCGCLACSHGIEPALAVSA